MVSTVKKLVLVTGIFWRAGDIFFLVVEHNYFWKYRLYFGFYLYLSYGFAKTIASGQLVVLQSLRKMRASGSQFLWKLNGVACFNSVYYYYRIDAIDRLLFH
jgi:hypothetical protein